MISPTKKVFLQRKRYTINIKTLQQKKETKQNFPFPKPIVSHEVKEKLLNIPSEQRKGKNSKLKRAGEAKKG